MKTEILKISSQISLTIEKNFISIKGPQGEKVLKKNKRIHCSFNNSSDILNCRVFFKGGKKEEFLKSDFKSFLSNLKTDIKGCSFAHSDELILVGVGYRFISLLKDVLVIKLGLCHNIIFRVPKNVTILIESPTKISLISADYSFLCQTVFKIKSLRLPDSYKGKGVRRPKEEILLKEVKKK